MAKLRNKRPPHKKHHTDRIRAPGTVIERWTNAKAGYVGFLTGQGKSSIDIEAILRDGTSAATIRRMQKLWRIPMHEVKRGYIVPLSYHKRRLAEQQAAALRISTEEFLKRICECTIGDGLYQAVTDGRYKA